MGLLSPDEGSWVGVGPGCVSDLLCRDTSPNLPLAGGLREDSIRGDHRPFAYDCLADATKYHRPRAKPRIVFYENTAVAGLALWDEHVGSPDGDVVEDVNPIPDGDSAVYHDTDPAVIQVQIAPNHHLGREVNRKKAQAELA